MIYENDINLFKIKDIDTLWVHKNSKTGCWWWKNCAIIVIIIFICYINKR